MEIQNEGSLHYHIPVVLAQSPDRGGQLTTYRTILGELMGQRSLPGQMGVVMEDTNDA